MRATFFEELEDLYRHDKDMYVLTADLGFKLFDAIRSACRERFYDVGVAEANMASMAAGLSLCGKNVYCYSIVPFLIMRAFEQIRVDIDYHNLNVKLVGVGGGFTYGLEGLTHFGLEDFALMSSLQNMAIVAPADRAESLALARASHKYKGPMYIRLGRTNAPDVYKKMPSFRIGKAVVLEEGKRVAIFAIGDMVHAARQASSLLSKRGIRATLINMHTLKPLDLDLVSQVASTHDIIISVEEHNRRGGLGTAIGEALLERRYKGKFESIGIPHKIGTAIGSADYLRDVYGLTPEKIAGRIIQILE